MAEPALGGALQVCVPGRLACAGARVVVLARSPAARIQGPAADQVCAVASITFLVLRSLHKSCDTLCENLMLSCQDVHLKTGAFLCHPTASSALRTHGTGNSFLAFMVLHSITGAAV